MQCDKLFLHFEQKIYFKNDISFALNPTKGSVPGAR